MRIMVRRATLMLTVAMVVLSSQLARGEFGDELFVLQPTLGPGDDRDPIPGSEFGSAVAISGNYALVAAEEDSYNGESAGAVWLFDVTTGQAIKSLDPADIYINDGLGESVAASGSLGVLGSDSKDDETGAAYLFDLSTATEILKLPRPNPMVGDQFGQSAAIQGDLIVIGAVGLDGGQGGAYVMRAPTGELLHRLSVGDPEEAEVGKRLGISGNTIVLISDNNAAYLFDADTGAMRKKITLESADGFGKSLAVSGNLAVIGADDEAEDAGAAYVIDLQSGEVLRRLSATDAEADDKLGESVAINGTTVAVTAIADNSDAGSVYIFDAISGMQLIKLSGSGTTENDEFGTGIALNDDGVLVVGAPFDVHSNGAPSGLAYLFDVDVRKLADVNDDGLIDVSDLDGLTSAVASASGDVAYDLNHDGAVDGTDRTVWIEALKHTYLGDSNLDGKFDSSDLVAVFAVGEYEDAIGGNSTWGDGDWNGDGDFSTSDLVAAFAAGGYDAGPRASVGVASVPEPASSVMLLTASVLLALRRRRCG